MKGLNGNSCSSWLPSYKNAGSRIEQAIVCVEQNTARAFRCRRQRQQIPPTLVLDCADSSRLCREGQTPIKNSRMFCCLVAVGPVQVRFYHASPAPPENRKLAIGQAVYAVAAAVSETTLKTEDRHAARYVTGRTPVYIGRTGISTRACVIQRTRLRVFKTCRAAARPSMLYRHSIVPSLQCCCNSDLCGDREV